LLFVSDGLNDLRGRVNLSEYLVENLENGENIRELRDIAESQSNIDFV